MKTVIHVLDIDAPPNKVFFALTLKDQLSSWWTTNVETDREKGMLKFHFSEAFNPQMTIVEQTPDKEVEWQCVGGYEPWHESTITFSLVVNQGETQLTFIQNYVKDLTDIAYGRFNFNWGYYLDSLRQYCETGAGKPFQP